MKRLVLGVAAASLLAACSASSASNDESTRTKALEAVDKAASSTFEPVNYVQVAHPEWIKDAVIYQVNTRQFTSEGTFAAAQEHLPRLAELGVDVLWLMPIHPIGEDKRKGSLGSPYSVRDFQDVNPEFGTKEDFKAFVDEAHALGMKVILDWVANHSAWDNPLMETNPDWYDKGPDGKPRHTPWTDWTDIVDLNYESPGLRQYMTESFEYWVREYGVDGFRCDVAGFVPMDFWETLRPRLDAIRPVFMLAEWESRDMHRKAFDATYAWSWKNAIQEAVKNKTTGPINSYFYNHHNSWPEGAMRMMYTSNHDQNAWDGTAKEIYGDALDLAKVFAFTNDGIPLIYNGQEAGLDHMLEFFEKDEIVWKDDPANDLFKTLITLKTETTALHNGFHGAPVVSQPNSASDTVFSYSRTDENGGVFVVLNLSDADNTVTFPELYVDASGWTDVMSGEGVDLSQDGGLTVPGQGYRLLKRTS